MANEALKEAIQRGEAEGDDDADEAAPNVVAPEEEEEEAASAPVPPVEAPAMTEKEIEARNKRLDTAAQRHRDAVAKIMGDDALVLQPCPLCLDNAPGFVLPAGMVEYSVEEKTAALVILGEDVPTPLREAEGVQMCERCDGYGELAYPTRNPHRKTQMCPKCQGEGYVLTQQHPLGNGGGFQIAQPAPAFDVTQNFGGMPDQWQRPIGHPHYGIPPADVRP